MNGSDSTTIKQIKFLHGERLYALADHLRYVEEVRNRFPEYSEVSCVELKPETFIVESL